MSSKEHRKFFKKLDDAENTARIRLFSKASKKYSRLLESANKLEPSLVSGIRFLSKLYAINDDIANKQDPITTGTFHELGGLATSISNESLRMALPGGLFGEYETDRVFNEVLAILCMDDGMITGNDESFQNAISKFLDLGNESLFFSRYVRPLKSRVTGSRAALECEARHQIIKGAALADRYPNAAIPHYMIATRALRAARKYKAEIKYREVLIGLRMIRRCWFCGRLVQGTNHYVNIPSTVSDYFEYLLRENKEDLRVYDGNSIAACLPCASAITNEAERVAKSYSEPLVREIDTLKAELQILRRYVSQLTASRSGIK